MDIPELYQIFTRYPIIVTDSRQVVQNSIFFALKGEKFNGNEYATESLKMGAAFAVVDEAEAVLGEQYILVEDSLLALQELSAYHREHLSIPIIAITGSNGKTTTKELTRSILSTQYIVKATSGNLNNHIGVPLTLLEMDSSTELGIVEMGANHHGEIALLCRLAKPDYGLITNVGLAHLEGFGNFEGVKKAKGELYEYLDKSGGLIFCNAGNTDLNGMLEGIRAGVSYYGQGPYSECTGEVINSDPFLVLNLRLKEEEDSEVVTGLAGAYNLENVLAAAAIAQHFRIRLENIRTVLQDWSPDNNRSQRVETDHNTLIMDAYNANPTSMGLALDNFANQDHERKMLILGDMLELGKDEVGAHEEIINLIADMNCEVFLVGPVFSGLTLPESVRAFPLVENLLEWLDEHPLSDRLILLKGSRGIGLEHLIEKL